MTESEAIKELKQNIEMPFGSNISNEVSKLAIKALEEIQKYQAIGTVEKFLQLSEQFKPHVTDKTSCTERHCNKCDQYREENEKYHEIGTVEECQEARERQRAKNIAPAPVRRHNPVGDHKGTGLNMIRDNAQ